MIYKAAIFDLDGVVVDTARFHYLAWKELADELNIAFAESDNERLKGVSRDQSLEILLSLGEVNLTEEQRRQLAEQKNKRYCEMLQTLTPSDILPGAGEFIKTLREHGVKIALGSASKNAAFILKKLDIRCLFHVVVDGNMVQAAKPDPQVFLLGAELTGTPAEQCVVFEDSVAGIEAAVAGGMYPVGIGSPDLLMSAKTILPSLVQWRELATLFGIEDYYHASF